MEALLKLIEEYKGISLELLKGLFNEENTTGDNVMNLITGFGSTESCSICKDAKQTASKDRRNYCECCIYRKLFPNTDPDSLYCTNESYYSISEAENAEELYEAIQERIQVLEQAIEDYENIRVYKR
jgi:hypothetical protein